MRSFSQANEVRPFRFSEDQYYRGEQQRPEPTPCSYDLKNSFKETKPLIKNISKIDQERP
jgi:hypothetical protein